MSDADRIPAPARLRSARRRLLVALVLLGVIVFLWLRSIIHTDTIWFSTVGGQFNELQISNGIIALRSTDERLGPAEAFVVRYFHSRDAVLLDGDLALRELPFYDKTFPLFGPTKQAIVGNGLFGTSEQLYESIETQTLMHATVEDLAGFNCVFVREAGKVRGIVIAAPYYAVFLLMLLVGLWQLRRWLILRKRVRRGLCLECGYNIGHSSERCPECGTPIDRETRPVRRWGRYAATAGVAGLLVLGAFVWGRTSANVVGVLPPVEVDPVAARLEGVRATLKTDDMRLDAMIRLLAKTYGATFSVDWRGLAPQGLTAERMLSLDVENVELCEVLTMIEERFNDLSFDIEGNAIVLSSGYPKPDITRIYDAERLIALCESEWARGLDTTVQRKQDNGEYGHLPPDKQNRAKIEDEIAFEVNSAIGQRAQSNGLFRSSEARFLDGTLVVRTTRYGQFVAARRLAELLAEAERTAAVMGEQAK